MNRSSFNLIFLYERSLIKLGQSGYENDVHDVATVRLLFDRSCLQTATLIAEGLGRLGPQPDHMLSHRYMADEATPSLEMTCITSKKHLILPMILDVLLVGVIESRG
nr:hypothetical protein CFP56_12370 [Quercus suber]